MPQNTHVKESFTLFKQAAARKLIRQFTNKYNMVYFGRVDPRTDDYELVRGMTASASHSDAHYSVGTVNGYDITLLERRNKVIHPGKQPRDYRWLIMQFDLHRKGLPHAFIDANHHDETFFANMFIAFSQFQNLTPTLAHYNRDFASQFKVFTAQANFADTLHLLHGTIAMTLTAHYKQFDYEINDDQLLVYASNVILTPLILHDMLRVGLWLANELDHFQPPQYAQ